jgi:hypothetical protein
MAHRPVHPSARMELRAGRCARFCIALALVLLAPSTAHAQRVPEVVIWSAGASLFAPFVAVPVKIGILRLMALKAEASRLWQISAIEWLLWFPAAYILLRYDRASSAPLIVLTLFGLVVWTHRARLPCARWRSAVLLSLPTPILALVLPLLALASAGYLESHAA